MRYMWIGVCTLLLGGTVALAQEQPDNIEQCVAVIQAAAASLATECAEVPAMSMCYGNGPASVIYAEEADGVTFTNAGDVVSLDLLDTLTAGGANLADGEWGLIEFSLRLNFTDETVTMFSMGSVRIENEGSVLANVPSVLAPVTFPEGANIRAEPDTNAELTGVVYVGDSVRATGILPDGTWVRVIDEVGEVGWITVTAFDVDALTSLERVFLRDGAEYGSMQAFTLRTGGSGEGVCPALPPNGVIIQTGENNETFRLRVNDTPLRIAPTSTVFLTASDDELLRVDVLEGFAQVDGNRVEASSEAVLRSDDVLALNPYDYNRLSRVPVNALPRPIFLPIDFSTIIAAPPADGENPLLGITIEDDCTIGATVAPANVREMPNPGGRVRYVMQLNESAKPDARAGGGDGALWWRLAPNVWVSSNAVVAVGNCGRLPLVNP